METRKEIKAKCAEFMGSMVLPEQRRLIGTGTFGEVWTIKVKGQTPLLVQKINRCVTDVAGCLIEVICLSKMNSQYLPKLVYSGYTIDGKWCLIMQYFTGGTLSYHIKEEIARRRIDEKNGKRQMNESMLKIAAAQKKYIVYHLARGIEYLHSQKFVHG